MGITVNNSCFVIGDNQSFLWNMSIPDFILKKKTASVSYHFVCEGISASEWTTTYNNAKEKVSAISSTNLPTGANMYRKVYMILYDIYPIWNGHSDKTII